MRTYACTLLSTSCASPLRGRLRPFKYVSDVFLDHCAACATQDFFACSAPVKLSAEDKPLLLSIQLLIAWYLSSRYAFDMTAKILLARVFYLIGIMSRFTRRHIETVLVLALGLFAAVQYYLRPQSQGLDQIVANGSIKVLIADEPDSLFVFHDRNYGFEYELLQQYADMLGVELELDMVPYAELFNLLEGGMGDIAVGGIIDSEYVRRVATPTNVWHEAKATVLYRRGTPAPKSLAELNEEGVYASSRYFKINKLRDLNLLDDFRSEYQLLSAIDLGTHRFALSTNYRAVSAKQYLPNLNRSFILPERLGVVWALPLRADKELLKSLNLFLERSIESGEAQRLADRYFNRPARISTYDAIVLHKRIESVLPDFEYKFRSASRKAGIDWQLLAALAYQESHWSNDAKSPTGVRGIMQLTTDTAKSLGIDDRLDMDLAIDGAAKYLHQLRERLPTKIKEPERTWFAVGAYNVGLKHVLNAYKRAREEGLDRTKWATISDMLPTLYGEHFPQGVQAQHYVQRIQVFTDIIRFYDLHQRKEAESKKELRLLSKD